MCRLAKAGGALWTRVMKCTLLLPPKAFASRWNYYDLVSFMPHNVNEMSLDDCHDSENNRYDPIDRSRIIFESASAARSL